MKALSTEKCILEGNNKVNELFDFIKSKALGLKAYDMEKEIFNRIMWIGLAAMKRYFAGDNMLTAIESWKLEVKLEGKLEGEISIIENLLKMELTGQL